MIKISFNTIVHKFIGYIRENWGSPFIVGFMLLLMSTAFSLSIGLVSLANTIAVYAFYILTAGVILQLACFLKYCRKSCGDEVTV